MTEGKYTHCNGAELEMADSHKLVVGSTHFDRLALFQVVVHTRDGS